MSNNLYIDKNYYIHGYTYDYKDTLKAMGCSYDSTKKMLRVSAANRDDVNKYLVSVNEENIKRNNEVWQEACKQHGVEKCKKSDAVYPDILATFKELIKK